jgi:hypothetical protein
LKYKADDLRGRVKRDKQLTIHNRMKMYYSGCNLVLALIVALLCGQSKGIWPFTSVHATPDSQDIVYQDTNAKRVAIIGMLNFH